MIRERDIRIMKRFNIFDQIKKFNTELMTLEGIDDVCYDLDGFLSNIPHVIFLPKWNIPREAEDYYSRKDKLLTDILNVAQRNGLSRTGDRIEDYGSCWYIVTRCSWPVLRVEETAHE